MTEERIEVERMGDMVNIYIDDVPIVGVSADAEEAVIWGEPDSEEATVSVDLEDRLSPSGFGKDETREHILNGLSWLAESESARVLLSEMYLHNIEYEPVGKQGIPSSEIPEEYWAVLVELVNKELAFAIPGSSPTAYELTEKGDMLANVLIESQELST